jgi:hypothetical protein
MIEQQDTTTKQPCGRWKMTRVIDLLGSQSYAHGMIQGIQQAQFKGVDIPPCGVAVFQELAYYTVGS